MNSYIKSKLISSSHQSLENGHLVNCLLPSAVEHNTEFHKSHNSNFDYRDHYITDANKFDYFEEFSDQATVHENRRLHETIIHQISHREKEILDVGSGQAWVAKMQLSKNFNITSFDISETNVIKALKKYPHKNHYGVVGDAYQLPFKKESFENVIAAEVLEHVADPKLFVNSLLSVVKKGGKLIITTPYNEIIPHYLCVHCNKPTPRHAHLHSFDEKSILNLVDQATTHKQAISFSNVALTKLRTHKLLKHLPFKAWQLTDAIANRVIKKKSRLALIVTK